MMTTPSAIEWTQAKRLFSISMCLSTDLVITEASPTLTQYLPQVSASPYLLDVFDIHRPTQVDTYSKVTANIDALYLMISCDKSFAIRGQMLLLKERDSHHLCFLGAPWLYWVQSRNQDLKLQVSDFSIQDTQLDQLSYMSSANRMVQDLETLNAELETARRAAEEAQQAKNSFFIEMSHEMRTPLNGMISALTLLERKSLAQDSSQLVTMAKSSSENLLQVINYVLDISRLESDSEESEFTVFDCHKLARQVVLVLRARALEKSLELDVEYAADLPTHYRANAKLLSQALLNLITNAIDFTDQGHIKLAITGVETGLHNWHVRFAVADTGQGIKEEDQPYIFEPFWRAAGINGRSHLGTGLGLDIVRRNVERLEGRVGLESRPGEGSTFWFEVPLQPSSSMQEVDGAMSIAVSPGSQQEYHGKVLLAEDNLTNLELGRMLLESYGLTVTTACNGLEAVEKACEEDFDLVFMDLQMPHLNGIEATAQIRQLSGMERLPIVALTASVLKEERELCIQAGMSGYMIKPVEPAVMNEELGKWLEQRTEESSEQEPDEVQQAQTLEAAGQPATELLDGNALRVLEAQLGEKNFAIVFEKFLEETESLVKEMSLASPTHDEKILARTAHTLASSFRSFGLSTAGDALIQFEQDIKSNSCKDIEATRSGIQDLLALSLQALHRELEA